MIDCCFLETSKRLKKRLTRTQETHHESISNAKTPARTYFGSQNGLKMSSRPYFGAQDTASRPLQDSSLKCEVHTLHSFYIIHLKSSTTWTFILLQKQHQYWLCIPHYTIHLHSKDSPLKRVRRTCTSKKTKRDKLEKTHEKHRRSTPAMIHRLDTPLWRSIAAYTATTCIKFPESS